MDLEEKILSLINFIRFPKINEAPDVMVPNHKIKSTDLGVIGTSTDFFIKEILFSKYKSFAYKYDFYWDTDDSNMHQSSHAKKKRLNHYNATQRENREKFLPKKFNGGEISLKNIIDYLKKYYSYSYKIQGVGEDHILNTAQEIKQVINVFNAEIFKPKEYILINPWFGTKKIAGFFYTSKGKIPHKDMDYGLYPDLIVDDTLFDIKCNSKVEFTAKDYAQLLNYLIWFEFSREHLKFAKPLKKIGIYFSRFNYLHLVELSEMFRNNSRKKILQAGKQLIRRGIYQPGRYIQKYCIEYKTSIMLSDIKL